MIEAKTKMLPICGKEAESLNIILTCGGASNVELIGHLAAIELTTEGKARMCCVSPIGAKMPLYVNLSLIHI